MASSVIHMCVANEVNKKLKRNNDLILIGTIAPDISKQIGENKIKSHFLDVDNDIPNLKRFLEKYKKYLKDDFVLGYYIHLYTDYLWFRYFFDDFVDNGYLTMLDNTKVEANGETYKKYFYNDYTTLNKILIDSYNLDLKIFNNKTPKLKNIIKEIPMNNIQIIIDKADYIIRKSYEQKNYIFDKSMIDKFISNCTDAIISNLEDIKYIKN